MRFSFEVGDKERHRIDFAFNQFWGNLKISVDGEPISKDFRGLSFDVKKRYEFPVGVEEQHEVAIEKERKVIMAGIRKQKYRVYVDGNLVHQYEGF